MLVATIAIIALALVGHTLFWIGLINRVHGTGLPRAAVKGISLVLYLVAAGVALLAAWQSVTTPVAGSAASPLSPPQVPAWVQAYTWLAAVFGVLQIGIWGVRRWQRRNFPRGVAHQSESVVDICQLLGAPPTTSPRTRFFCQLPFNQLWQLRVAQFDVALAGLPAELDGLSICHLSDLHFSPRIERSYYDEVVQMTNELQPDMIALTGDICDKAHLIDWIPHTLGKLQADTAKLYVLGNHDLRTQDVDRLRREMVAAGFVDVGGRIEQVAEGRIVVAGNERPWFRDSAPQVDRLPAGSLKLLLSHSPDQFGWARRHGFDLMLAGHTHGGQVRFPVLGPLLCPSIHGTRYACGFFHRDATLLHVSRGTASLFPFRMNCRPEIIKLTLHTR